ncbi:MAG: hypothetical protein ACE367_09440 [Acidimicrobiales bacterium]
MAVLVRIRKHRVLAAVLVAGTITALLASGVAVAHHYDSLYPTATTGSNCAGGGIGTSPCRTDNKTVTYYYETNMEQRAVNAVGNRIGTQYEPTNLTFVLQSPPVYTGSAEMDIIFGSRGYIDSFYGAIGITWCNDNVNSQRCDQHYVYFDTPWYQANNWSKRRGNACHEIGHAVGLQHGARAHPTVSNSTASLRCLGIPSSTWIYLGSHNEDQIDGHWN